MRPASDDRGFVLIAVLWLLLLCGSLVALMMLRNVGRAQASRDMAKHVQAKLDLQAAVDTVAADMLLRGVQSRWAMAPVQGSVDLGGRSVSVEVSNEAGRLDLNDGDLTIIDHALQGLGFAAAQRTMLVGQLQALRAQHRRLDNAAALSALTGDQGTGPCLDRYVTLYSGLGRPDESAMPSELAHALAVPQAAGENRAPMRMGVPVRLRAQTSDGLSLTVVARLIGTLDRTYDVLRWTSGNVC